MTRKVGIDEARRIAVRAQLLDGSARNVLDTLELGAKILRSDGTDKRCHGLDEFRVTAAEVGRVQVLIAQLGDPFAETAAFVVLPAWHTRCSLGVCLGATKKRKGRRI